MPLGDVRVGTTARLASPDRRAVNSPLVSVREDIPALHGVRGLAVLAIVAHHVAFSSGRSADNDLLAAALRRLDFGLAVLGVLAGFLIYGPFCRPAVGSTRRSLARFARRRGCRILPALWLTVGITFLVTDRAETSTEWWEHVSLVQSFSFYSIHPDLSHLWAISAVVGFYIVVLLGVVFSRRARDIDSQLRRHVVAIGVLVAVAVLFNVFQHHVVSDRPSRLWPPAYLDWFALGMLLAVLASSPAGATTAQWLRRVATSWSGAPGSCWTVAGLLWLLSTTQLGTPRRFVAATVWQWNVQHVLYGVAAFFIVLPFAFAPNHHGRLLGGRALRALATISYGMFLWHLPVMVAVQERFDYRPFAGNYVPMLTLTLSAAVVCATASWYLIERPISRLELRLGHDHVKSVATPPW